MLVTAGLRAVINFPSSLENVLCSNVKVRKLRPEPFVHCVAEDSRRWRHQIDCSLQGAHIVEPLLQSNPLANDAHFVVPWCKLKLAPVFLANSEELLVKPWLRTDVEDAELLGGPCPEHEVCDDSKVNMLVREGPSPRCPGRTKAQLIRSSPGGVATSSQAR